MFDLERNRELTPDEEASLKEQIAQHAVETNTPYECDLYYGEAYLGRETLTPSDEWTVAERWGLDPFKDGNIRSIRR